MLLAPTSPWHLTSTHIYDIYDCICMSPSPSGFRSLVRSFTLCDVSSDSNQQRRKKKLRQEAEIESCEFGGGATLRKHTYVMLLGKFTEIGCNDRLRLSEMVSASPRRKDIAS